VANIEKRQLGNTGIEITPVGLGCMQFGNMNGPMNFYKTPPQDEVNKIVKIALEGGINWFDTAEAYGRGNSEKMLSTALCNNNKTADDVVIATKWFPMSPLPVVDIPFFPRTAHSISDTVPNRQKCLSPFKVDLYQIHRPYSVSSIETQMDTMAALVKEGKIRSVGISQFSAPQMRRAHAALAKHGIPLASNQVWFSLSHRAAERNGVMQAAKELNITIISWCPLSSGLLTGKFHKNPELVKKLPFIRRMLVSRELEKTRPLMKTLEDIAKSYNCSVGEVALSWAINFHGDTIVVIPGATKAEHINQNIGALKLKLTKQEMARLDEESRGL
jgi:aryl-alcohol dehydrogenase-like predicted oxidoreductase